LRTSALLVGSLVAVCLGCAARLPSANLGERAAAAAGVREAVVLRSHGEPLDVTSAGAALPLDHAVALTLRHDPRVQAALARVRAAESDARQARLLPNPMMSVMVRFPEGGGEAMIEAGLMADVVAVLTQPRRVSAADHRLRSACEDALGAVLDALDEVRQQYAAAQAADARAGLLRDRRATAQRLVDVARSLVESGRAPSAELLAAEAGVDEIDADAFEVSAEAHHQRLALARLVGEPSSPGHWELDPPAAVAAPGLSEAQWVDLALRRRPEVQAARWQLAALGDESALAATGVLEGTSAGAGAERDEGWHVGPSVMFPLPLFDWGRDRRDKAKAARVEARHKLTQARRQAVEDVRRAVVELSSAQAALEVVQSRLIPHQQQRRERAQAAFESGVTGLTPVLMAEQDLQKAVRQRIELRLKAAAALSRLHRAAGGATAGGPQ
jgi:cobalt-zinc-cadmium efflux system outer membrane protein